MKTKIKLDFDSKDYTRVSFIMLLLSVMTGYASFDIDYNIVGINVVFVVCLIAMIFFAGVAWGIIIMKKAIKKAEL